MSVTVFLKDQRIAHGEPADVARKLARQLEGLPPLARSSDLLAFDDETGAQVDLDLAEMAPKPVRGRPSLGVEAREVTLLPRHWTWLAAQPGGASAALRRLVEAARKEGRGLRERRDAAYRFLTAMAGDRPGYEEAMRALFAGDRDGFDRLSAEWPYDVRAHGHELAWGVPGELATGSAA